ncbi:uncharacterized protein UTRI_04309_B [Ustilago trichophora]|uniref:Uncharacterized protein n=1 Tax=Ustilago trichophora TaxID=86804 RepID=A0A5C3EC91_9BASI|nr:uncharacterized protein UTRI_04309_B [Ustilago trichophora]
MDLSNLRTSLREEESSTLRRTSHLRAAEDELNAFFRSSALGLTTLYRQGVAASKASYEKGYAHALAHVLELWDKDRDWLKGYLQRRIEAIEAADNEDEIGEEATARDPVQQPPQQQAVAGPSMINTPIQMAAQARATESPRHNKRSRSTFLHPSSTSRDEEDNSASDRRLHRMPHGTTRFSQPSNSSFSSNSSFNFSAPLSYPITTTSSSSNPSTSHSMPATTATTTKSTVRASRSAAVDGPVIKTSNPATSRRRLQKLKGLRAGRERVIEIEKRPSQHDDMVDEGEDEIFTNDDDGDAAWTDDDEPVNEAGSPSKGGKVLGRGKKVVLWSERNNVGQGQGNAGDTAEGKVLERMDRRKRRRGNRKVDPEIDEDISSSGDGSRELLQGDEEEYVYHS